MMMMIFMYCSWVSTQWQWSVNLYKNRKETDIYAKGEPVYYQYKNRIRKIESKPTKPENKCKKNVKKNITRI